MIDLSFHMCKLGGDAEHWGNHESEVSRFMLTSRDYIHLFGLLD